MAFEQLLNQPMGEPELFKALLTFVHDQYHDFVIGQGILLNLTVQVTVFHGFHMRSPSIAMKSTRNLSGRVSITGAESRFIMKSIIFILLVWVISTCCERVYLPIE